MFGDELGWLGVSTWLVDEAKGAGKARGLGWRGVSALPSRNCLSASRARLMQRIGTAKCRPG